MLQVTVINPDEIVHEGEAEYVLAPTARGMVGLLAGHTPFFTELTAGDLIIHGQAEKIISIQAGILKIRADVVTILIGL